MTSEEVLDKIEEWHLEYTGPLDLFEYMGWTRAQYRDYVENGIIPE